ncbi:MAG: PelD GGDEF domain-containing protein [Betaproteobacteria bacterium]|nr:PelD GGDEF domain-containing protein [Betaproteobacteria bacterium]
MSFLHLKANRPPAALADQIPRDPRVEAAAPQWSALGQLTSPTTSRWAIIGETILLPIVAVALGVSLNPQDPLWTQGYFPWAWFAPVVLALRYGPLPGIGGAGILLLAWMMLNPGGQADFPKQVYLGGLILVMVIGEFSSLWLARTRRAETMQRYLDQRLEFLTHQHYLLRLSHDRLEQDLISRPMAMRDALSSMRNLVTSDQHESDGVCASALLRLLAQYCQLEVAALHQIQNGALQHEPLGTLGETTPLTASDPLIAHALETGKLCHISQSVAEDDNPSRYLIVAPLTNLNGERFGLLVVERLPFFSLQDETLQTINLLLGYYADSLSVQALADPIRSRFPQCPPDFAFELQRLWHIRQISRVISAVVVLDIRHRPGAPDLAQQIQREKRALDENWLITGVDRNILVTLMPLAGTAGAEGYLARLEYWARQRGGKSLPELGIVGHILTLDREAPLALLQQINDIVHA